MCCSTYCTARRQSLTVAQLCELRGRLSVPYTLPLRGSIPLLMHLPYATPKAPVCLLVHSNCILAHRLQAIFRPSSLRSCRSLAQAQMCDSQTGIATWTGSYTAGTGYSYVRLGIVGAESHAVRPACGTFTLERKQVRDGLQAHDGRVSGPALTGLESGPRMYAYTGTRMGSGFVLRHRPLIGVGCQFTADCCSEHGAD